MEQSEIKNLASKHGLQLTGEMSFNDMGLDFQVVMATDMHGIQWVLRIPRRDDQAEQIDKEKEIINLAKRHLSVAVPNWKITQPDLVAYPLLENKPVLTYDSVTYEVFWNMDKDNPAFVPSLAQTLLEIHNILQQEVESMGLKSLSPQQARQAMAEHLENVKSELGLR